MDLAQQILSDITVFMKYAKYIPELKRRETWDEIVKRNEDMHIKKYPHLKDEIGKAFKYVREKKVLPSMRALEDNTPIITKNGWKRAGAIEKDDILYDSRGNETRVIDTVHFKNKPLYKITFNDKSEITCCGEHLWIVSTIEDRSYYRDNTNNKTRVVDTLFIKEHLKRGKDNNIFIWNPLPIQRPERQLPIDPYILGLWLGNGAYSGGAFSCAEEDANFFKQEFCKAGFEMCKGNIKNPNAYILKGLRIPLRANGLFRNKHIPRIYLESSVEQRLELLRGLMDTDGSCDLTGRASFNNTNPLIIEGVKEILSSLGIRYGYITVPATDVHKQIVEIRFFTDLAVFKSPRKLSRMLPRNTLKTKHRNVVSVDEVGKGNASCFHVDSPDHSFLAGKTMIVTHNSLQFAGKPIELAPNRIFNCTFTPIDDYHAFSEIMYLLLGGSGVGFSVQRHHVDKLPEIRKPKPSRRFLVTDDITGWSDAVKALMKAYFFGKALPNFDFSDIRPKGARLVTSGGKAPGPEPLKDCLHNIKRILDRYKEGEKLSTIDVHDIICFIALAVLAGGIRRSSLISLFSYDDEEMLSAKSNAWWELNPQRSIANNSVVLVRHKIKKEDFYKLWEKIKASGSGEPGFFFTNNTEWGLNP